MAYCDHHICICLLDEHIASLLGCLPYLPMYTVSRPYETQNYYSKKSLWQFIQWSSTQCPKFLPKYKGITLTVIFMKKKKKLQDKPKPSLIWFFFFLPNYKFINTKIWINVSLPSHCHPTKESGQGEYWVG